jgi:8-oxo-dGTP pyrophosphatase MutT (NUDIX family)
MRRMLQVSSAGRESVKIRLIYPHVSAPVNDLAGNSFDRAGNMAREPIPTWCFALVVVRRGDQFLVVRERKHGQLWYLPAGRVEAGETFAEAAHRETLEESGVPIVLEGILKVQHTPSANGARLRLLLLARPADDTPPRAVPNEHTLEARFVTLGELAALPLRGPEVKAIFEWVANGAAVAPMELLGAER